ncbi:uncharacterized protein BT62DRAFT_930906 [Guyanagaster necrorhizus]|uniref:Uncharacterized protein n=1 Tax=Guyanagaster necrorhizus TaxID=856835 RepID=A0A9P7VUS3_9AGAR|nr:uncharacterized protein BT62DRAFT_930906 [Guyanagaster necrorhizus MCA 3950]KAG7447871.1 hypothetical protein BT62DRAFT_930906 [Guyanagaster necrorhizus MCA 3950]
MERLTRQYASNKLYVAPAQTLEPEIYDRPCTPEPFRPTLKRTDSTETLRVGRSHRQQSRSGVTSKGRGNEAAQYKFPKKRSSSTETVRPRKGLKKELEANKLMLEDGDDIIVYPGIDDDIPTIPDEDNRPIPIALRRPFLVSGPPPPPTNVTNFFGQKLPFSHRDNLCSMTSNRLVPQRFNLPQKLLVNDVCADDDTAKAKENDSCRSRPAIRPTVWDMNASLTFYEKSRQFFDVWDMDDSQVIAIPARMHFLLKDPERWADVPMENTPDIRYIDFRCQSFDYEPPLSSRTTPDPEPRYMQSDFHVDYRGPVGWGKSDGSLGICAFPVWRMTAEANWFMKKRRCKVQRLSLKKKYEFEFSDGEEEDWDDAKELMRDGWYLKFMIPIPISLFKVKETRAFRVEAAAWIGAEESGGVLMADTDFMVSHLRLKEIAKR